MVGTTTHLEVDSMSTTMTQDKPLELDFSQAHFLDHHWWEFTVCRQQPWGGFKRHVQLVWEYGSEVTELRAWWGRAMGCWWGHHTRQAYWRGKAGLPFAEWGEPAGYSCEHCARRMSAPS